MTATGNIKAKINKTDIKNIVFLIILAFLLYNFYQCSSVINCFTLSPIDKLQHEVSVSFVRYRGDRLSTMYLRFNTRRPHKEFFITNLSLIVNEQNITIVRNKRIKFKYSVGVMNGLTHGIKKINLNRYFRRMTNSDEVIITINMQYYFDDGAVEIYEEKYKLTSYRVRGIDIFMENFAT